MRKITALSIVVLIGMSILFIDSSAVRAAAPSSSPSAQIVPTTKRVSHRVYRKGRWVTVTTWKHGKKISKKVWKKSNRIGHKVGRKTRDIVMGPKKPTP